MSCLKNRTWNPVWSGKSQLPCSQQLRLHGLTSSDFGGQKTYRCEFEPIGQASRKLEQHCQSKDSLQKRKKLGRNVLRSCLGDSLMCTSVSVCNFFQTRIQSFQAQLWRINTKCMSGQDSRRIWHKFDNCVVGFLPLPLHRINFHT